MRAAAYLRVSNQTQTDNWSLPSQQRVIEEYCARQGWPPPAIYREEGKSAFNDDYTSRPAFVRLLEDAEAGRVRCVIVVDLDRFARSTLASLTAASLLERCGCAIVSLNQAVDFSTPDGRLMFTVNASFSEYFSRQLSRKVKAGLVQKRAEGGHIGGIPFGARRVGGRLEIDPDRADDLALLLALARDRSLARVAAELNARGVPPSRPGVWHPSAIGQIVAHGTWLLDQPPPWPERWALARDRPKRPSVRTAATVRMLTGLMRCICGGRIRYSKPSPTRGYHVAHCLNQRDRPGGYGCTTRRTAVEVYEAQVAAQFLALPRTVRHRPAPDDDHEARRVALVAELRRAGVAFRAGAMEEGEFEREQKRINGLIAATVARSGREAPVGAGLGVLQDRWPLATPAERNAILALYYDHVLIDGPTATAVPNTDLAAWLGED